MTRSRPTRIAALVVAGSLALAACASTGPDGFRGALDRQVLGTSGRPFGLGIGPTGTGYALQLDRTTAAEFDVVGGPVSGTVALAYNPIDVAFAGAGALAYFSILDQSRVYTVNTGTGLTVDSVAFGARHHRILMHPDGDRYWVISLDGVMWAVHRATGVPTDSATFGGRVLHGLSRRPSDGTLALSAGSGVVLLDGATLDSLAGLELHGLTQEVVHSADGAKLFVAIESRPVVMVLDAATLAVQDSITFGDTPFAPFGMRLSPNGGVLLVSSADPAGIAVVDARSLRVRRVLSPGGVPRRVAFSPDGKSAFVSNEAGWIDVLR